MYIFIINPAIHGKKAYTNKGSARRVTNYLEKEAKATGEQTLFFNADRTDISGNEAVQLIDSNRKGLRKEEDKFHSIVISPSAQELEHIGHDPQKLQAYTARVMQEYAANFSTKSGQPLSEKDLVWVATQHNERKHRGHDGAPSGQKKEGPQTHIHITVSARDKEQKVTLNPWGSAARFNRVTFMAKGNVAFEDQFGPVKQVSREGQSAAGARGNDEQQGPTRGRRGRQTAEEMADSIRRRAAAKDGRSGPNGAGKQGEKITRTGDDLRDKQLFNQVDKVNKQLPADRQLVHNNVLEAARKLDYSKAFYGRLGQLGREAQKQRYHDLPYEFLRTGKDAKTAANTIAENQQRDKRLLEQVERLNKKLPEKEQLVHHVVLQMAREQDYSKAFYGRLNRIGREAQGPKHIREPYEFLRTGRVPRAENKLDSDQRTSPALPRSPSLGGQLPGHTPPVYARAGARTARSYQPSTAQTAAGIGHDLGRALSTQGYTQDVRGDEERD
ncbi:DUF5712 family protein [Hymenobacter guriensis]|uniref:Mobilization protein n=1 Tax=Hymenobacter guriensis TaxID=2793065 RepID=A0ABS0L819_9BACT|nr:DUF5712 family protein [Hymenobacter guriensis]MBG8556299.1 hypothetical protein [Hymenobacter guriensis]